MSKSKITKFFEKNKTPLLVALGVIVVVIIIWLLRKKKGLDAEEIVLSEQYTGQNITSGMPWRDMATRLRKAFGGPNSSATDEDEVYNVLSMLRTQADWDYLKRYWITYYKSLPWYDRLHNFIMNGSNNDSLVVLMKYELDDTELQLCRDILNAKGITPDF